MKTFQDRNELEQLRATVAKLLEEQQADLEKLARQARTITAREKSILEIWQDWRKSRDERDEARELCAQLQYGVIVKLEARIVELELNHVYMNERILVAEGKA